MAIILTILAPVISAIIFELLKKLFGWDIIRIIGAPVQGWVERARKKRQDKANAQRYLDMVEERKRIEAAERLKELEAPERRTEISKPEQPKLLGRSQN